MRPFDNEDLCEVLDLMFDGRDGVPDWPGIAARLAFAKTPPQVMNLLILQACWLIYEDDQAVLSRLYKEKHGL